MKWHMQLAKELKIKHSDTMSVIRWGKKAKHATNKRIRRIAKREIRGF